MGAKKLSDKAALEVYRRRWGIEVFFRTLKQTFDRRKLRWHSASNAPVELEWSLLALWGMCLIGEECLDKSGVEISTESFN
jgi:IS4 transposase